MGKPIISTRKLPSGVQTFSQVRLDYDVYVDKTLHIYNMVNNYKVVFLSRPRRFGKSLTCSTLEALFTNEKKLFKGLAIEKTDWKWKEHPVIRLDTSAANFTCKNGLKNLRDLIDEDLEDCAENYEIELNKSSISRKFSALIKALYKKKGPVVVIVDEYDCPMLDTLHFPKNHELIRKELQGFYKVLKGCDKYLKFVFITGVTKFSQVSLFSGMNQPEDISMHPDFCALCGITQEELEKNFDVEIEKGFKYLELKSKEEYLSKLKNYYNGYHFSRDAISVYNPTSIIKHFISPFDFKPFWSETGTPSFLVDYVKMQPDRLLNFKKQRISAESFAKYDKDTLSLIPLLYQAGYLTISSYDKENVLYTLGYPNGEVKSSFAKFLASYFGNSINTDSDNYSVELTDALKTGNVKGFMEVLKIYLQKVDYSLIAKIKEYYFEFAVANILNMLGVRCNVEVHSALGSVDAVIEFGNYIYIMEFKKDKSVATALKQIEEKGYATVYKRLCKGRGARKIIKLGVKFSSKKRNVVDWKEA
ncbi:MAG: ATP-binding protein [Fibromonadales bacterium]|nr:ATP-binding protein [Fibromonadales bacterium]